jgi:hypothetical protein
MIGSLIIVHVQNVTPAIAGLFKLGHHKQRLRQVEALKGWLPEERVKKFPLVLNVYLPSYPELRMLDPSKLKPVLPVPFPRRQAFEEIFYGFVERVGELFDGWTELGQVATPWQLTKDGGESMEFRWIYDHLLIATDDECWQDKLHVAEAECEEAFLAVVTYYSDLIPLARQTLET